ncbi:TetR-like C-terminal domain-containing protein, partial [Bacillus haynesii]|uniref:TetR-like C-terminal domain-containing protein n=1 Tax=Bacillus haynesii TaxID=1925021 RepID=UPI002281CF0C
TGLYEATFIAMPDKDERLEEARERVLDLVLSVLKDYHLDDDSAIHAVRGLRSILHGFAALRQHDAFGLPYDVEESLDLTIRVFLKGIAVYQTE